MIVSNPFTQLQDQHTQDEIDSDMSLIICHCSQQLYPRYLITETANPPFTDPSIDTLDFRSVMQPVQNLGRQTSSHVGHLKSASRWLLILDQAQDVYFQISQFLTIEDLLQMGLINSKLRSKTRKTLLKWSVHNSDDSLFWATVTDLAAIARIHSSNYHRIGVNYDEQSEHSRDLDRTFLLDDNEQIEGNKLKLDRVLRALTKNKLYFQGLNYVASAFLTEHHQQNTYWYIRFILHKGGFFQNDIDKLAGLVRRLEIMMCHHLPRLIEHLDNQGLSVHYFATKWFIVIYSYDTPVELMLRLWKLLALSDQNILICFTICFLRSMEESLLDLEEEDLNMELKTKLKLRIADIDPTYLLETTVQMYTKDFSDVLFGFDQSSMSENGHKNSILPY